MHPAGFGRLRATQTARPDRMIARCRCRAIKAATSGAVSERDPVNEKAWLGETVTSPLQQSFDDLRANLRLSQREAVSPSSKARLAVNAREGKAAGQTGRVESRDCLPRRIEHP